MARRLHGVSRAESPEHCGSHATKFRTNAVPRQATQGGSKRMKRGAALLVVVLGTGLGLGFGLSASANSAVGRHAARSAARVVLLGTQSRPIFRVTGTRMHVPRARPKGSPSGRRLCSLRI